MCDHKWTLASAPSDPDRAGRRTVNLVCERCDERINKITTKSNREIAAELEAQQ